MPSASRPSSVASPTQADVLHTAMLAALEIVPLPGCVVPKRHPAPTWRDAHDPMAASRYSKVRKALNLSSGPLLAVCHDLNLYLHTSIGIPAFPPLGIANGVDTTAFTDRKVPRPRRWLPFYWRALAGRYRRSPETVKTSLLLVSFVRRIRTPRGTEGMRSLSSVMARCVSMWKTTYAMAMP